MRWCTASLVLGLFTLVASAASAADDVPCPLSFAELETTLSLQFRDLMERRGGNWPPEFLSTDEVSDDIDDYLSDPQRPGDDRERTLLVYVSSGETMCVVARASYGSSEPAALLMDRSTTSITQLVEELGIAVRSSGSVRSGQPVRRGETRGPSRLVASRPTAEVLADLQTTLFPAAIIRDLHDLAALYVVPAGNIGTVPFALLDPDGDGVPLVETTSVTIAPSLRDVVGQPVLQMGPISGRVSVFGDPDATRDPEWDFPRLPAARREAEEVARIFSAVPIIGDDATVAEALRQMEGAQYIHIAAHGYSDPANPLDGSFLAFTDGRLTARQLQTVAVGRYAIAVMSACQTGLGGVHEAGIIGLARAFMLAGSAAVIASLWNVDDDATAFMMARFAELLGENDPAEALRLAQLETRKRWPDPVFWAPFVAYGHRILSAS